MAPCQSRSQSSQPSLLLPKLHFELLQICLEAEGLQPYRLPILMLMMLMLGAAGWESVGEWESIGEWASVREWESVGQWELVGEWE